jgi:hypothetical protein
MKEPQVLLFLDFDGVLHPDEVYLTKNGPKLQSEGTLFMWSPLLVKALAPFPEVDIVLSTSWVRNIGFHRTKKCLPLELQDRVIGATWHSNMQNAWSDQIWWDHVSRHDQILRYVSRARAEYWVALDDDADNWSENHTEKLIQTQKGAGLTTAGVLNLLNDKLVAFYNHAG